MKRNIALLLCFLILIASCSILCFLDKPEDAGNENEQAGVVLLDSHLTEAEKPMDPHMAQYAARLFNKVYAQYLSDNDCYFALVPDKYRYLTDNKKEYDEFYDYFASELTFAKHLNLYELLDKNDYYKTDIHWRQECLLDVAKSIYDAMGKEHDGKYNEFIADTSFKGNYVNRTEMEVERENLIFLTNDTIDSLKIEEENIEVYDFGKLATDEMYDFFLSGNQPVVHIKNPTVKTKDRLIIFRDSFASSIAPLLCEDYKEVVLVDLRYIMSENLSDYVDFKNADVLFLYSTTLLNSSLSMR